MLIKHSRTSFFLRKPKWSCFSKTRKKTTNKQKKDAHKHITLVCLSTEVFGCTFCLSVQQCTWFVLKSEPDLQTNGNVPHYMTMFVFLFLLSQQV